MTKKTQTEDLKAKLRSKAKPNVPDLTEGLPTGSTLLNLACTGRVSVGFPKGHYVLFVGDSASGKTFVCLTCLAEAANSPAYDAYRLILDAPEEGALMNFSKYFGKRMADRLEAPKYDGSSYYSETVEEFLFNIDNALDEGPCVYVLDSLDALNAEADEEGFLERKAAHAKGRDVAGSYGTAKAKALSNGLRRVIRKLKQTGSILVVISQTRENIGFGSQFSPKTRGGGKALRFYATLELWSSIRNKITKMVKGEKETIGVNCRIEVKKNRVTGRERDVEVPIYYSVGIDDIGSCVDFLVTKKHWAASGKGRIEAEGLDKEIIALPREKLIEWIEENGAEANLRRIVAGVWADIEDACEVKRKRKYH